MAPVGTMCHPFVRNNWRAVGIRTQHWKSFLFLLGNRSTSRGFEMDLSMDVHPLVHLCPVSKILLIIHHIHHATYIHSSPNQKNNDMWHFLLIGIPHISIPRLGFNMVFKDPNLRFPTGAWRISGARSRLKEPFNCTASAASTTTGLKPCSRQREALLRWRFKETKPGFRCQNFVSGTFKKKSLNFESLIFGGSSYT